MGDTDQPTMAEVNDAIIERARKAPERLSWRVTCEHCRWARGHHLPDRDAAIAAGRMHVKARHASDEEWGFRVQGFRP